MSPPRKKARKPKPTPQAAEASDKAPAFAGADNVAQIFSNTVREVTTQMLRHNHKQSVDIELSFQSVAIDQKGVPLLTKHTQQSQMQIRLATQITPE